MDQQAKLKLDELLSKTFELHGNHYADNEDELTPMYLLFDSEDMGTVAVTPMSGDPMERNAIVAAVAGIAQQMGAVAYTFTHEGWTLPQEYMHTHTGGSMRDNPHRVEVLMVEAGLQTGEHAVRMYNMLRQQPGSVQLELRDTMYDGEGGARMKSRFNIFNPNTTAELNLDATVQRRAEPVQDLLGELLRRRQQLH